MTTRPSVEVLRCSFCGKSQDQVSALIGSPLKNQPAAYICDECVAVCDATLERKPQRAAADSNHKTGKGFYRVKSS
ncbi:MAG TPA: ClpX C4-type zinc finger protein [Candidatus Angelobacter sp.]